MSKEPIPTWDQDYISDLSEKVYRQRLEDDSGKGAPERMIAEDGDGGKKLRNRAGAYDVLTRAYLDALGFRPSRPGDRPLPLPPPGKNNAPAGK